MTNQNTRDDTRLLGIATSFTDVLQQVSALAPLQKPALIVGERGTGKELIAARLHYLSNRWQASYNKLNCAAMSDSLIESELFGHESGAFTGANKRHIGRFERSDGGSLFLDELATSSSRVQEQLLRVIEYGEFERVGGNQTLKCDVRLIAATNEDLPSLADQGRFRADLLDRLSFDVINLPPLRARQDDILLLAEHFATTMSHELGQDYFAGFSDTVKQQLLDYQWPGNVRELKNVAERSVYKNHDWQETLTEIVLDPFDSPYRPRNDIRPTVTTMQTQTRTGDPEAVIPGDLKRWLSEQELSFLKAALVKQQFNQRRAAEQLGLSYHQFRAYTRKYPELVSTP